mgnify:CR=1 FL=1
MMLASNDIDRRRHARYALKLGVRFMLNGEAESTARLIDVSACGASFATTARPRVGDRIIAYIDTQERLEGVVDRLIRGGLAVRLELSPRRQERLDAAIAAHLGAPEPRLAERRHLTRHPGDGRTCTLTMPNGSSVECAIADFSIVGACLISTLRPPIGTPLRVGKADARVVRHTDQGFAVEFDSYWDSLPVWHGSVAWTRGRSMH